MTFASTSKKRVDLYRTARFGLPFFAAAMVAGCGGGTSQTVSPTSLNSVTHSNATNAVRAASASGGSSTYASTVLADSPLAYYRLDDTAGTATDASGHGLSGTYGSTIHTGATSPLATEHAAAADFPGGAWNEAGIIRVPENPQLEPTKALTVEVWARTASISSDGALLSYGNNVDAPFQPYAIKSNAGTNVFVFAVNVNGVHQLVASKTAFAAGPTYHVVGTFDGNQVALYVNGNLETSVPASGTITNYDTVNGLAIGGRYVNLSNNYDGTLSNVAIYGTALSQQRVRAHYTAGSGGSTAQVAVPAPPSSAQNLVNGQEWATSFTPYGPASVWNTRVSANPTIAAYSANVIAHQFPGSGSSSALQIREPGPNDYGHPVYFATGSDPVVNLACTTYCNAPDNGGVPATMHIPPKARPAGGTDASMAVIQPDGTEIDFFAAYGSPGSSTDWQAPHDEQARDWQAGDTISAANIANCGSFATGSGFMAVGPGSTAADQCDAGGQVKINELTAGVINHAIAIQLACANGAVYPAPPGASTDQCTSGVGAPLGARLWYDVPDDQTNANPNLHPWERAILNALHDYGGFFTDNGSGGSYALGMSIEFSDIAEPADDFGLPDPRAALAAQGWVSTTVSQLPPRNPSALRWYYPDVNDSPWNPQGVDFSAHVHWLDPCSARNSC